MCSINGVYEDCLEDVENCLSLGGDPNLTSKHGETPLHSCSDVEVMKNLLHCGADVTLKDSEGRTPLHSVLENRRGLPFVQELLNAGSQLGITDNAKHFPLHDADVSVKDSDGRTPLFYDEWINAEDSCGATPLHYSIRCRSELSIVKLLINHGAKVNVKDNLGYSPFYHAILSLVLYNADMLGVGCVRELLLHGADVNANNYAGHPPLYMAWLIKSWYVIKELLEFGAEIQFKPYKPMPMVDFISSIPVDERKNIVRLCVFGYFDVDNKIEELCNYIDKLSIPQLLIYLDECVQELVKTKQYKIVGFLSLKHFIVRRGGNIKPLHLPHRGTEIKGYISKHFPIYSDLILPIIDTCLYRGSLINDLKTVRLCTSVFRSDNNCLYDCLCLVAQYLSNEELCNFIEAFKPNGV